MDRFVGIDVSLDGCAACVVAQSGAVVKEAKVATSPGIGFGPGGEGYVRFAMIENEQRTQQAMRNLKATLTELTPT